MRSSSTSEAGASAAPDVLVRAENLSLVFQTDVHRPVSLRELFTRALNDPGELFMERDRLQVARDLSFDVRRGDRIALLGVNGVGKTSLCRVIAGMYRPTTGKLIVRGKVRAVFDAAIGILPELTGRENAWLVAKFMYSDEPDLKQMVDEAMEFSELGRFLDVPFRLYSNGMQARLCLSLVSCKPCDILILDEVFEGADTFFKEKIAARILSMVERSGAAFFVSHSADQVRRVCNRVMVLQQGQVAYDGPVEEGIRFYEKGGQC